MSGQFVNFTLILANLSQVINLDDQCQKRLRDGFVTWLSIYNSKKAPPFKIDDMGDYWMSLHAVVFILDFIKPSIELSRFKIDICSNNKKLNKDISHSQVQDILLKIVTGNLNHINLNTNTGDDNDEEECENDDDFEKKIYDSAINLGKTLINFITGSPNR